MRDATKEEIDSVNQYVKQISTPTGINFYDLLTNSITYSVQKEKYGRI